MDNAGGTEHHTTVQRWIPKLAWKLRTERSHKSTKACSWFEQNTARTLFTIHGERFTLGQFYHEYQNLPPELQTQFSGSNGLKKLADSLIERMHVLDDAYNKLVDQENAPLLEEGRASILRQMIHKSEVDSRVNVTEQEVQD